MPLADAISLPEALHLPHQSLDWLGGSKIGSWLAHGLHLSRTSAKVLLHPGSNSIQALQQTVSRHLASSCSKCWAEASISRRETGSTAFHWGSAVGIVQWMVAPSEGKVDGSGDRDLSHRLAREWLLLEVHGLEVPASVDTTIGIRVVGGSLGAYALDWLVWWLVLIEGVVATVFLTWKTMSVTTCVNFASEEAWRGTSVRGGEVGTVSSIPSSAASSWSDEGTAWHRDWRLVDCALPRETGLAGALTGGSSMPSPGSTGPVSAPLAGGCTSLSGIAGLERLPHCTSWNAFHQCSLRSPCTRTLLLYVANLSFL